MRTKRFFLGIISMLLIFGLFVSACEDSPNSEPETEDKSYTVTFNSNGGSSVLSQTVISGYAASRPTNPTRSGYTFDNWYTNSGLTTVYDFLTPVTSNITLYAKWNPVGANTVTVTFNSNGGSSVSTQTINSGSTATRPANPTRSGYTFDNWYSNSGLTTVYNFSTPVTSNITLYANWNTVGEEPEYELYRAISDYDDFIYTDGLFKGKFTNAATNEILSVDGFLRFYITGIIGGGYRAGYGIGRLGDEYSGYTLFVPDDAPASGQYDFYVDVPISEIPLYSDDYDYNVIYTNIWDGSFTAIEIYTYENIGYTTYTVTFDSNGGNGTIPSQIGEYSTYIILPDGSNLSRPGYVFAGWSGAGIGEFYYAGSSYYIWNNTTLYAEWYPVTTYTVTFDANGGSGTVPSQTEEGVTYITLPDGAGLSKTGYIFGGWNTNAEGTGTDYAAGYYYYLNSNTTLYAKWNQLFTVTYNANGGSGTVPSEQGESGTVIIIPGGSDLSKTGYVFGGWNTNAEGTGTDYSTWSYYTISGNITLYAKWNPVPTYTVTFDIYGGTGTAPLLQTGEYGTEITLPDSTGFTRTGYTFAGWNTNIEYTGTNYAAGSNYTVSGNATLYAKWNPVPVYTVTFDINEGTGTVPSAQTEEDGTVITLPDGTGLSKTGYTFNGWWSVEDGTMYSHAAGSEYTICKNITFYVAWSSVPTFTVTFDANGGSGTVPSMSGEANAVITLPFDVDALTKTGYQFTGWNTKADGTGEDFNYTTTIEYTINGNVTLYAQWGILLTLTYDPSGGTGYYPPISGLAGGVTYLHSGSVLSKPGYVFTGWNTNADGTGTDYEGGAYFTIYSNITLYAIWNPIYTVTYNANGGTGTAPSAQSEENGTVITLPGGSELLKAGYVFGGWNTNAAGTGTSYAAGSEYTVSNNTTLYAKWNQLFTVTYNTNTGDGTVPSEQGIAGTIITLPDGNELSKTGYVFSGWNTNAAGTGTNYAAGSNYTVNNNITMYAKWYPTYLIVSFAPDAAPVITKPIIHRSYLNGPTTATFTVENPALYDSISWKILSTTVTGSGSTFILSTTNTQYNTAGEYVLTVEVIKDGVPFSRTINFTVAN